MPGLSRDAARMIQTVGVHACTDITGFALLGHSCEMAEKSGARLRLFVAELPFLEGAKQYAKDWLFPAGSCNNQHAYQQMIDFAPEISEEMQMLLFTPETSGGLLVAVPPENVDALVSRFAEAGQPCWLIGDVEEGTGVQVTA